MLPVQKRLNDNRNLDTTPLDVYIRSRNKVFYRGIANTLTSKNDKGEFDVLKMHANFITLIKEFVTIDKGLPTEQRIPLDKGVLSVLENKVDVYAGI